MFSRIKVFNYFFSKIEQAKISVIKLAYDKYHKMVNL